MRERGGLNKSIPIKNIETIKQIKELYAVKKDYNGLLIFLLAINTGANLKDILDLNVRDIKGKQYLVFDNKRSIPLNGEIKSLVKKITENKNGAEPLFSSVKYGKRLGRAAVFFKFREICRELALGDGITVASWRKTFGYHYYLNIKICRFCFGLSAKIPLKRQCNISASAKI